MKVHELIANTQLSDMLLTMDWNYDLDLLDNERFSAGKNKLEQIKQRLKVLAESDKPFAQQLWEDNCPWALFDPI